MWHMAVFAGVCCEQVLLEIVRAKACRIFSSMPCTLRRGIELLDDAGVKAL